MTITYPAGQQEIIQLGQTAQFDAQEWVRKNLETIQRRRRSAL